MGLPTGDKLIRIQKLFQCVKDSTSYERKLMLMRIIEKYSEEVESIIYAVPKSPFKDFPTNYGILLSEQVEECIILAFEKSKLQSIKHMRDWLEFTYGKRPAVRELQKINDQLMMRYEHIYQDKMDKLDPKNITR